MRPLIILQTFSSYVLKLLTLIEMAVPTKTARNVQVNYNLSHICCLWCVQSLYVLHVRVRCFIHDFNLLCFVHFWEHINSLLGYYHVLRDKNNKNWNNNFRDSFVGVFRRELMILAIRYGSLSTFGRNTFCTSIHQNCVHGSIYAPYH